jgi:threonyl-tRNA synthetase
MREIIAANRPFVRDLTTRDEAHALFEKMGETYKRELVDAIPAGEEISLYKHGDGSASGSICARGPHVPRTGALGAVKLVSVAGAYWRGDERNPMLQRIYGTAFPDPEGPRRAHEAPRRGEGARPQEARQGARSLHVPRVRPGHAVPAPARGGGVQRAHLVHAGASTPSHGYEEVITPQVFDKRSSRPAGTCRTTARTCTCP